MPFPASFVTARLQAERLTANHFAEQRRMDTDPAVMEYIGGVRTDAETAAYMTRNLQHWDDHGFGLWVLREIGSGAPIGRAVLRRLLIDGVDEVEVGCSFYEPYWGRGLGTEVTQACLEFGRDVLRLPSMVALTHPDHVASQHVLRKAGLTYEREVVIDGVSLALFRFGAPPGHR